LAANCQWIKYFITQLYLNKRKKTRALKITSIVGSTLSSRAVNVLNSNLLELSDLTVEEGEEGRSSLYSG